MQQRLDALKTAGAFAAIYLLWGGTYLAIALGLQSIPAFILIAARSLVGGAVLLLLSYVRTSGLRPLGDWGHAAVGGAFLFIYDVLDRTMAGRMADIDRYRGLGRATGFAGAEVRSIGAP